MAAVEWVKVGTNVVVGGAAGAVDQLLQNWDERREEEKGAKLGIMTQAGTYYNYGVPILAILGAAFGFLKGDWASRLVIAGSTLAGRKAAWHVTKRERVVAYTKYTRNPQLEAQRRASLTRARAQVGGAPSEVSIPIIADENMLV